MAFAGTFGASGNLIPFALIQSKQYGQATGYDASGNLQFTTPGGTVFTPDRVDDLVISAETDQNGPPLAALANNTDNGSAADTGVLVTAAPAANQHGLPANFGLGRGNWAAADLTGIHVEFLAAVNTVAGVTNVGGPLVRARTPVAVGNFSVAVKNMSEVALESCTLLVQVEHSIQP